MAEKKKHFFCDTTVIYYLLHGHPLQQAEVKRRRRERGFVISRFVRGEYIRGYIIGLLELYFAIKLEVTVEAGLQVFAASNATRHPRWIANAFSSVMQWLGHFDEPDHKQATLRRLGEYVRKLIFDFDYEFPTRVKDPLRCEYGVLEFPQDAFEENVLLDFYDQCQGIYNKPECDQCAFREQVMAEMQDTKTDLHSKERREEFKSQEGYVKQARWLDAASRRKPGGRRNPGPTCWYCDRLGDSIVALSAPANSVILTGDKQSFPAIATILKKELELVPSIPELENLGATGKPGP